MLVTILKPDFTFENENGKLFQLAHEGYKQINVLTSVAGSSRGGHYHMLNNEVFFVSNGQVKVLVTYEDKAEEYTFSDGDMFSFPPFHKHSFLFIKDTTMVAMYDKGVELPDGGKDIYVE